MRTSLPQVMPPDLGRSRPHKQTQCVSPMQEEQPHTPKKDYVLKQI